MATRRPLREPASVSDDRRTTVRGKLTHHVGGDASYTVRQSRSAEIGRVAGLLRVMPWTGALFTVGALAVAGLPPSGIFIAEFALVRAGFAAGHWWTMGLVLGLLTVAFIAVVHHLNRMLYGVPPRAVREGERPGWSLVPLAAVLLALVALGVVIPDPLERLLVQAAEVMRP